MRHCGLRIFNCGLFLAAVLIATLFTSGLLLADEGATQFEQANQLYRSGKFKDAAALYEQIVKNGYESPELYFNEGNAYFKMHNLPAAIIAYERAKRLAPHDEDIAYNLRLANLRIVDKIDPVPGFFLFDWWRNFINLTTADGWAKLTLASLWGMVVLGGIFVVSRSFLIRRVSSIAAFLLLVAGIICLVGEVKREAIETSDRAAVVVAQSVPVKSAPDAQSTDLFVIHEGLKLEVLDAVGEWNKIRLADGKIGWLMEKSVEGI